MRAWGGMGGYESGPQGPFPPVTLTPSFPPTHAYASLCLLSSSDLSNVPPRNSYFPPVQVRE